MDDLTDELAEVVEQLPRDAREVFAELLGEPLVSFDQLYREVEAYLETIEEKSREYEFMDTVKAKAIAEEYFETLSPADEYVSERDRRLIQAGVRYYIESDDAEDDFSSPIGFDDDAQVTEVVLDAVGDPD